ncbi:2283_t:CDS:2, partial [Ambispora gerdemannii]
WPNGKAPGLGPGEYLLKKLEQEKQQIKQEFREQLQAKDQRIKDLERQLNKSTGEKEIQTEPIIKSNQETQTELNEQKPKRELQLVKLEMESDESEEETVSVILKN